MRTRQQIADALAPFVRQVAHGGAIRTSATVEAMNLLAERLHDEEMAATAGGQPQGGPKPASDPQAAVRRINAAGLALIKKWEGLRLTAYLCPAKVWTIGYGSTGAHVKPGMTITEARAEELLREDLDRFERAVARAAPGATDNQFAAMVSLAFNVGLGDPARNISGFLTSTVLRRHLADEHEAAATAFAMWNKAKGKVLPGLVSRRAEEAALYRRRA